MGDARPERLRLEWSALPDRARIALKHGLSLSDDELDVLTKLQPAEVEVRPMQDAQRQRLLSNLEVAGVRADFAPSAVNHAACPAHPRLATAEVCPRCEQRTCFACRHLTADGVCPACTRKLARRRLFRNARIGLLLVVLIAVALSSFLDRRAISSWERPITVALHPVAVEADTETSSYVADLSIDDFREVERYLEGQASRHGLSRSPLVELSLGSPPAELPPSPPASPSALNAILFSLRLRLWAWRFEGGQVPADVRLFLLYHQARPGRSLAHSIGLKEGHIGLVNAFAHPDLGRHNNVILVHELLHTAGATDKYEPSGEPKFPEGYADPEKVPQVPQEQAEIMAGMIPLEDGTSRLATSLEECVVGARTAEEIGWR